MRFGCSLPFTGSEQDMATLARLADLGYRYLEPSIEILCAHAEPSEYFAMRRALNRAPLSPEAFSWWHPPDLHLIGDHVDWAAAERYLALVLERIEELDGLVLAITRSYCRDFPPDYPPEDALSQVRYFLNMAADYAGDVTVAVGAIFHGSPHAEHLPEPADLVRELGRPQVTLLVEPAHAPGLGPETWPAECGHVHMPAGWLCDLPEEECAGLRDCADKCSAARGSVVLDAKAEDSLVTADQAAQVLGLGGNG